MLLFGNTGDPLGSEDGVDAIGSVETKAALPEDFAQLFYGDLVDFGNAFFDFGDGPQQLVGLEEGLHRTIVGLRGELASGRPAGGV